MPERTSLLEEVRVLTFNVAKSSGAVDVLLKMHKNDFDVLMIQSWRHIQSAPSAKSVDLPIPHAAALQPRGSLPTDPEKLQGLLDDLVGRLQAVVQDNNANTLDWVESAAQAVASAFSDAWLAHSSAQHP